MYYDPEKKKKLYLVLQTLLKGGHEPDFRMKTAGIEARFIFFFNKRPGF